MEQGFICCYLEVIQNWKETKAERLRSQAQNIILDDAKETRSTFGETLTTVAHLQWWQIK